MGLNRYLTKYLLKSPSMLYFTINETTNTRIKKFEGICNITRTRHRPKTDKVDIVSI